MYQFRFYPILNGILNISKKVNFQRFFFYKYQICKYDRARNKRERLENGIKNYNLYLTRCVSMQRKLKVALTLKENHSLMAGLHHILLLSIYVQN